ncbi:hypothetical protein HELRODRAFT_167859 [Helobdella robusta]|uniref:Uncharacterized protein n=1 Tax=Helobdella robusta TaxID=6412 RepID=T1EZW1_HELRO|nr:hypothetical protein HELRODRAFT_167859 [Helobdella robusta]ESO10022.1 hypothetical protein HELRODRAFT_167859 [Helobdella robusta]
MFTKLRHVFVTEGSKRNHGRLCAHVRSGPTGPLHSPYSPPTLTGSPLSWFPNPSIFNHNFALTHPSILTNAPNGLHDLSPLSESLETSQHNNTQAQQHAGTTTPASIHMNVCNLRPRHKLRRRHRNVGRHMD